MAGLGAYVLSARLFSSHSLNSHFPKSFESEIILAAYVLTIFERFCTLGATAVLGNGIISNDDLLLRRFEGLGDVFHDGWVVLVESLMSTKLLHVLSVAWAADPLHGVAKPSRDMNNGRADR